MNESYNGQRAYVIRFKLKEPVSTIFDFGLVPRLLVGRHGLFHGVNLHHALRILRDKSLHGSSLLRRIRGIERSDVGVVLSRIFDGFLAGRGASLA